MLVALRGAISGARGLMFSVLRRTDSSARGALLPIDEALQRAYTACESAINPKPPGGANA